MAGERAFKEAYQVARFATAELGRHSGMLDAATFALKEIKKRQAGCWFSINGERR